jgi:hypothetical protein
MTDQYKISATLKGQGSSKYDAPWIVVYGDTAEEVSALLDAIQDAGLPGNLASADAAFKGATNVAVGLGGQPVSQGVNPNQVTAVSPYQQTVTSPAPQATAPQGPVAAPADNGGGSCAHGVRVFKSGEKNGNTWKGWFCPARVQDCKPQWVK